MNSEKRGRTRKISDSKASLANLRNRLRSIRKSEGPKLDQHFYYKTKRKRTYAIKKLRAKGFTYFQEFLAVGEPKQYGLYAMKSPLFKAKHIYWGKSTQLKTYQWRRT